MAVPPEMTVLNTTGKYIMSKRLSDDTDELLRLQGLGWFKRRIIKMGTLYLTVRHFTDDAGVEHIDILQSLSGLSDTDENRALDWVPRSHEDDTFGKVSSRSRRIRVDEVENEWLRTGWTPDTEEHGLVFTQAESKQEDNGTNWVADQTWGFEMINGEKRYVRHVFFQGPNEEKITLRLVYDYQGTV
ncbi:uncharacterized protein B0H18DRAFT_1112947 [Fomitopsis serialis]|uniref:uncharacterized protein n=1 Tax=Fomitopsis serialis TaxID=139415 RepID=UPI0020080A37|nr:uncharacterized protein B0H18DRAFT_1112947 [Neoantrodia serialis]KAH9937062.1 hypothetical protein B0H18DRAFT_1112947 [Neoantrodia serialis]